MDQLHRLSCPFTWEMKNVVSSPQSLLLDDSKFLSKWNLETDLELGSFTLMKLMYSVMLAFENGEKGSLEEAMQNIEESEEMFIKLQSMPNGISIKAVDHIIKSTKCFILKEMKRFSDVTNILKSIDTCDKEKLEIGTLYGCQSIAWSFYFPAEGDKAIQNASRAIELNSDNEIWHFILGKCLRRQRRYHEFGTKITIQEQTAFKNAFDLSPTNPHIGIYCAQMYRESYELENADRAYIKVFAMKPYSCDINLKLALRFIRTKNYEKASECLKYVASRMPKDNTYLHYKGIYLEKCEKDYEGALKYYKEACALTNYAADMSYVALKISQCGNTNDTLEYLFVMLDRHKSIAYKMQAIHLNIGSIYYIQKNMKDAGEHYLKAIKIDPQNTILENFFNAPLVRFKINIFDVLKREVISVWKTQAFDQSTREMLREAEEACNEYNARFSKTTAQKMTNDSL